jgi:hypothetical protein
MVENLTRLQAENIATLAAHVLSLIEGRSPDSRIQAGWDLLGTACQDYANELLYRVWSISNRPELWEVGAAGVADFARSESQGIDTRLSAAPPEVQEIVQAYLRERDENEKLKQ